MCGQRNECFSSDVSKPSRCSLKHVNETAVLMPDAWFYPNTHWPLFDCGEQVCQHEMENSTLSSWDMILICLHNYTLLLSLNDRDTALSGIKEGNSFKFDLKIKFNTARLWAYWCEHIPTPFNLCKMCIWNSHPWCSLSIFSFTSITLHILSFRDDRRLQNTCVDE